MLPSDQKVYAVSEEVAVEAPAVEEVAAEEPVVEAAEEPVTEEPENIGNTSRTAISEVLLSSIEKEIKLE